MVIKRKRMFDEQVARTPNLYPWTVEVMDSLIESPWSSKEFNFKADFAQFHSELNEEERQIIVRTLSAIGQVEIAVKTFWRDLGNNLPHPYITDMGCVMAYNEVIHNQAYERLLDILGLQSAFEEALKEPVIMGRVKYLKKHNNKVYKDNRQQYIYSLILFSLFVENVSLFSQFYIIMHFHKTRALLKDTAQQVQYTRNEENLHATVGKLIINTLRQEYPEYFHKDLELLVRTECEEALKHEINIVKWIIGEYRVEGLSAELLEAYIKNRLNESLIDIGFSPLFNVDNDLVKQTHWMELETQGTTITDFFQKRVVEYSKNNKSYSEEDIWGV